MHSYYRAMAHLPRVWLYVICPFESSAIMKSGFFISSLALVGFRQVSDICNSWHQPLSLLDISYECSSALRVARSNVILRHLQTALPRPSQSTTMGAAMASGTTLQIRHSRLRNSQHPGGLSLCHAALLQPMLQAWATLTNIRTSSRFAIGVTLPFLEIRFQSFPSYMSQCAARKYVPTDG